MAEEAEVLVEVEAVQSVYGHDCRVIREFPPHINVHIKPRTADDSSKQFVEAIVGIQASFQYPKEPPQIEIVESKGLDENQRAYLVINIQEKAEELSSCLMLISLCEEAVETLSDMNHPDGDCPLCLYPLVTEYEQSDFVPFMKLMSCFHCFHSECIMRWWKWLQEQNETNSSNLTKTILPASSQTENERELLTKGSLGSCPVCRKMFHTGDIEHVLDMLQSGSPQLSSEGTHSSDDEKEVLQSEAENLRRQKFEAVLKIQQENSGLIKPRKSNVLLPGMFLPEPVTQPTSTDINNEQQDEGCTSNNTLETDGVAASKPSSSKHNNLNSRRKNRGYYPRKQSNSSRKQWTKKECNPH